MTDPPLNLIEFRGSFTRLDVTLQKQKFKKWKILSF